jgi:hypothetical protein
MAPARTKKVATRTSTNAKHTTRGQTNTGSGSAGRPRSVVDELETPAGSSTEHVENPDSEPITANLAREIAAMKGQWRDS